MSSFPVGHSSRLTGFHARFDLDRRTCPPWHGAILSTLRRVRQATAQPNCLKILPDRRLEHNSGRGTTRDCNLKRQTHERQTREVSVPRGGAVPRCHGDSPFPFLQKRYVTRRASRVYRSGILPRRPLLVSRDSRTDRARVENEETGLVAAVLTRAAQFPPMST